MNQIDPRSLPCDPCNRVAVSSEPPPEVLFERLLPRYQRRFGSLPPVTSATVEEVNRLMRRSLAEASDQMEH